ncbi:MAG: di-heme oxidoredictase family protein [Actinomycetota bacterium]
MRSLLRVVFLLGLTAVIYACGSDNTLETALGGETTRSDASRNSFGLPAPGLTNDERLVFEIGDSFFTQNWVSAPSTTDARDGLGPVMNALACSSCHVLDGRGAPPDPDGSPQLGLLFRLSVPGEDPVTGGPVGDPTYGGQLQDRSILGVQPEGQMVVEYELVEGVYADGVAYELRKPTYSIDELAFGPLDPDLMLSPRLAPQVIGMGLLEAIPDETLLEWADPDDEDGDGISGRVNMVWNQRDLREDIGRFGWKANVPTVELQVAEAFHGDIGITSSLFPEQNCGTDPVCAAAPTGVGDDEAELTDSRLGSVTFYNRTLSVPALRNPDDPDVRAGSELFDTFMCSSCHIRSTETGTAPIAVLRDQIIFPFTDLLLHDMGPGLADGRPDFDASGSEWRTPPLWGLGLVDDVNGERFFLHDGRARTFEEAILWHGGEAEASKEAFRTASAEERAQLVAFLEAL